MLVAARCLCTKSAPAKERNFPEKSKNKKEILLFFPQKTLRHAISVVSLYTVSNKPLKTETK